MDRDNGKLLFSAEEISQRVKDASTLIFEKFPSTSAELVIVPLLEGASKASEMLKFYLEDEFHNCTPCRGGVVIVEKPMKITRSSGTRLIKPKVIGFKYSQLDFKGKDVVIIDDLVDEGLTLQLARKRIEAFKPASIFTVVIVKKSDINTDGWLDHACFKLGLTLQEARVNWLYGFGMDIGGKHRKLPHISYKVVGVGL